MVESDRISVTLITCGIAQTIALDILNGYRIGHTTGRPYKTKFYCVYGKCFLLLSYCLIVKEDELSQSASHPLSVPLTLIHQSYLLVQHFFFLRQFYP